MNTDTQNLPLSCFTFCEVPSNPKDKQSAKRIAMALSGLCGHCIGTIVTGSIWGGVAGLLTSAYLGYQTVDDCLSFCEIQKDIKDRTLLMPASGILEAPPTEGLSMSRESKKASPDPSLQSIPPPPSYAECMSETMKS